MKRGEKLADWRGIAERIATLGARPTGAEEVSLHGAIGRVLSEPLIADQPVPAITHAVMDGYALGSLPPSQYRVVAHKPERLALDEAVAVSAGAPLPLATACVVLASRAAHHNGMLIVAESQAKDNIRRAGEEVANGATLLSAGTLLDARHLALAAAAGCTSAVVRARPRVTLLSLHDGASALPHRQVFTALLDSRSLSFKDLGVMRLGGLSAMVERVSARHDVIIVVAESLGGEDSALIAGIEAAGGKASVLRAAMKPAKPVILGKIGDAIVIGLAGTAYATTVAAHLFLRPLLKRLTTGQSGDPFLPAVTGFARMREPGRAEALPARLDRHGNTLVVESAGRFGQLSALAAMDGFALVEADAGSIAAGDPVQYHPLLMPLI